MTKHILILRELSDEEIQYIASLLNKNECLIIADPELNIPFDNVESYSKLSSEEKKAINYQVLSDLLNFGDTTIDGQSISSFLKLAGADLWYYQKFRIYFELVDFYYEQEELKRNLSKAASVIIYSSKSAINYTELEIEELKIFESKKASGYKISIFSIISFVFIALYRFIKSIFTSLSEFRNKRIVCIDTIDHYRQILSLDGSNTIFENAFLGYLFQRKGDQIGIIDQLLIPKFNGKSRFRFNKKYLKNHNHRARVLGERIMVGALFSTMVVKSFIKSSKVLKRKYEFLKTSLEQQPDKLRILNSFINLNKTTLFYLFKFFAYEKFFRKSSIEKILTIDENSANFKTILDAGKKNGIITVGYQHGGVHRFHPLYIYTKADISQKPMPDTTITWGKKWSNLLLEYGNYPSGSVEVAGQIRTDVISELAINKEINKENIFPELNKNNIVLFATQPQRDQKLRYKAAEDVVLACKKISSIHLIFRLHPGEKDPEFYEKIANKYKLQNFSFSITEDLYVLLKIADLVITCFSTVGTEALYFRKPLVILDHLKQDIQSYHKDHVAFQATNAEELGEIIHGVLNKELSIDKELLEEYIQDSTYKIDGKVSDRVWDIMNTSR